MIPKITPIDGAVDGRLSLRERICLIWKRRLIVRKNKHKVIARYDQKRDPYCTAFASAGAYTYNTGIKFTNEDIYTWANPILKGKGSNTRMIANKFAKDHAAKSDLITLFSEEYEKIMDSGYALVVSTSCPTLFWQDGIMDGKVDSLDYTKDKTMGHAVFIFRKEGKDFICNSWGAYVEKGLHNEYEVNIYEMYADKLISEHCTLIA